MQTAINDIPTAPWFHALEQAAIGRIASFGMTIEFGWDFNEFKPILQDTYGTVNPTYDPAARRVHPSSFWIALTLRQRVVATTAFAYFDSGDLEGCVRDQSIWFDREDDKAADLGTVHKLPMLIEAPFTVGGATWAAEEWRGYNLPYYLNVLGRLHIVKYLPVNYLTGFAMLPLVHRGVPKRAYDYPEENVVPALDGTPPTFTKPISMLAMFLTREQAIQRLLHTGITRLREDQSSSLTIGSVTVTKRDIEPSGKQIGSQSRS